MGLFGRDGDAYLRYTMARELNPNMKLRLFQSGPGTLWTNMGSKDPSFQVQLPRGESKAPEGKPSPDRTKADK
jgi:hypothetical protein